MENIDQLRLTVTSTLLQAGRHWRQVAHSALAVYGISSSCGAALLFIGRLGEGVSQIALADQLGIEGASLVRILDQLSAAGLVRREKGINDRRVKTLWFTEAGKALIDKVEAELVKLRASVLENVSREDLEATMRVFRALEQAAHPAAEKDGSE